MSRTPFARPGPEPGCHEARGARTGDLPLVQEITTCPDPWSAFERLRPLKGILFFDSAMRDPTLGRYSFITADPFQRVRVASPPGSDPYGCDPFRELAGLVSEYYSAPLPSLPPFQGGAAGLFSYGLGRYLERIPQAERNLLEIPDMVVGLYDWVLAFDHELERAWLISQGFPEKDPSARRRRAAERRETVLSLLRESPEDPGTSRLSPASPGGWAGQLFPVEGCPGLWSNFAREAYLEAVAAAIEYVFAGDIFQVNLSQQLLAARSVAPVELYRRLRARNPAPFAAYFEPAGEEFVIASASPERFLKVDPGGTVETRPIKGTRPREVVAEADFFARDELLESSKDRSENVMIVDLLRNDLSRVCRPGSVEVPHLFRVEAYPTVHHLVSVVRGELREGLGPLDLLQAAFPGGSVTGAPKIRAMEIIAELEPDSRGAYCGSMGYISFGGAMDTSILIRTVTAAGGWFQFPVGGGIVAGSSPSSEYQETLDKARGILLALK